MTLSVNGCAHSIAKQFRKLELEWLFDVFIFPKVFSGITWDVLESSARVSNLSDLGKNLTLSSTSAAIFPDMLARVYMAEENAKSNSTAGTSGMIERFNSAHFAN